MSPDEMRKVRQEGVREGWLHAERAFTDELARQQAPDRVGATPEAEGAQREAEREAERAHRDAERDAERAQWAAERERWDKERRDLEGRCKELMTAAQEVSRDTEKGQPSGGGALASSGIGARPGEAGEADLPDSTEAFSTELREMMRRVHQESQAALHQESQVALPSLPELVALALEAGRVAAAHGLQQELSAVEERCQHERSKAEAEAEARHEKQMSQAMEAMRQEWEAAVGEELHKALCSIC